MEDKRPADSTLVPRVSPLAIRQHFIHLSHLCILFCPGVTCCSYFVTHTAFVILTCIDFLCVIVHHLSPSPSIVFADFFLMNLILWVEGSSAAIPFGTLVAILALWFGISVPLTFVGAYFGFKKAVS